MRIAQIMAREEGRMPVRITNRVGETRIKQIIVREEGKIGVIFLQSV